MSDIILKAISKNKEVRIYLAKTTDLVEDARIVHNLTKTTTAALGRTLTANVIMAADLKHEDYSISIQIRTNGPISNIITYSNATCNVKGYVTNPKIDLPLREDGKIDVGGALTKDGTLTIIKDIGLKEPYSGTIDLISGEIAEDITYYFAKSEQIPTAMALGVLVDKDTKTVLSAGGLMVQLLPEATEETIQRMEEIFTGDFSITKQIAEEENLKLTLKNLIPDMEFEILDEIKPSYKCDCSKYRFMKGIISLGHEEIDNLIKENKDINTECHFCNKNYKFTVEELKKIKKDIDN